MIDHHHDVNEEEEFPSKFRELLMKHSNLTSIMVRTLLRLLYKVRDDIVLYNTHGS